MKANRLEPGMPFGTDPVLLGEFPLEEVDLRAVRGQRWETVRVQGRLADPQQRAAAVGEHGVEVDVPGRVGHVPEEGGDSLTAGHRVHDRLAKVGKWQLRNLCPWDRLPRCAQPRTPGCSSLHLQGCGGLAQERFQRRRDVDAQKQHERHELAGSERWC